MEEEKDSRVITAEKALSEDIDRVRRERKIRVEYVVSVMGGPSIYSLTDLADGQNIGLLELWRSDYFPGHDKWLYHQGELQGKLEEMLETPLDQLKMLVESDKILYKDIRDFEADSGVYCYKPKALPIEERMPSCERQILYTTTEFFEKGNWYHSAEVLGTMSVNISEYVPGVNNYPKEKIYQEGMLRKSFTQNAKLFSAYVNRVLHNARNARPEISVAFPKIDWAKKADALAKDMADSLKSA